MRRVSLCALLAIACGKPTGLVVGLATNTMPPRAIDLVSVDVADDAGQSLLHHDWPLALEVGSFELPGSFTLAPSGSQSSFVVTVTGSTITHANADGTYAAMQHIRRRARLGFVDGHTLFYRMALVDPCFDRDTCAAGSSCLGGLCVSDALVLAASLPDYHAGDEFRAQCGDDALAEGLTPPTSVDCPAGFACLDSLCIAASPPDLLGAIVPPLGDAGAGDDGGATDAGALDGGADAPLDGAIDLAMTTASGDAPFHDDLAPPDLSAIATTIDQAASGASPDLTAASADLALTGNVDFDVVVPGNLAAPGPLAWVAPQPQGADITALTVDFSNTTGSPLWGVTSGGMAVRFDTNGNLVDEDPGASVPLNAVFVHGGDVWVGGESKNLFHRGNDGVWGPLPYNPSFPYSRVVALVSDGGAGVLAAVQSSLSGGLGTIVRANASTTRISDNVSLSVARGLTSGMDATSKTFCATLVGSSPAGTTSTDALQLLGGSWTSLGPPFLGTTPAATAFGCGGDGTIVGGGALNAGALVVRSGASWMKQTVPGGLGQITQLASPDGTSSDLYAASTDRLPGLPRGNTNTGLAHFDGMTWSAITPPAPRVSALAAALDTKGQPYVAVASGAALYERQPDGSWKARTPAPVTRCDGRPWGWGPIVVMPSANTVWATIDGGGSFAEVPVTASTRPAHIAQVFGVPSGSGFRYYAAGDGVVLSASSLTTGFDTVEYLDTGGARVTALWGFDASSVYAVTAPASGGGAFLTNRGGTWKVEQTQAALDGCTGSACVLDGLWGRTADEVYAVGGVTSGGAIYRRTTTWANVTPSYTEGEILAVWGGASTPMIAVGTGSVIYRGGGSAPFVVLPSPAPGTLTAIWGTSDDDVYAVGDQGAVMRFSLGAWTALASHTDARLTGVYAAPSGIWLGGADQLLHATR